MMTPVRGHIFVANINNKIIPTPVGVVHFTFSQNNTKSCIINFLNSLCVRPLPGSGYNGNRVSYKCSTPTRGPCWINPSSKIIRSEPRNKIVRKNKYRIKKTHKTDVNPPHTHTKSQTHMNPQCLLQSTILSLMNL